jgi:hypothetical protein
LGTNTHLNKSRNSKESKLVSSRKQLIENLLKWNRDWMLQKGLKRSAKWGSLPTYAKALEVDRCTIGGEHFPFV